MKNNTKPHLRGEMEVPDGRAPKAGWAALGNSITRTEDQWLEGNPLSLLTDPEDWWKRLRDRRKKPEGEVGLRVRLVMKTLPNDAFEFLELLSALVPAFPKDEDWLFLHAEIMDGPEEGVYVAYDNRPPALVTQLHLEQDGSRGRLEHIPEGPLHVNVLYHEPKVDLKTVLLGDTLKTTLKKVASTYNSMEMGRIHEVSLARSTSAGMENSGLSIGLERVRQEHGAEGGVKRLQR